MVGTGSRTYNGCHSSVVAILPKNQQPHINCLYLSPIGVIHRDQGERSLCIECTECIERTQCI